jgi:hypothetical protein
LGTFYEDSYGRNISFGRNTSSDTTFSLESGAFNEAGRALVSSSTPPKTWFMPAKIIRKYEVRSKMMRGPEPTGSFISVPSLQLCDMKGSPHVIYIKRGELDAGNEAREIWALG